MDESGWLIEAHFLGKYLGLARCHEMKWGAVDDAIRFARKCDAEAYIDTHLKSGHGAVPTEHMWCDAPEKANADDVCDMSLKAALMVADKYSKPGSGIGCLHANAYRVLARAARINVDNNNEHYTYASTQATECGRCGELKHTPLRNDAMGGYVCLTCIDLELGRLQREAGKVEKPFELERLVERFLNWPLPKSVCVDEVATVPGCEGRTGTNLLTADEAREMLEYVIAERNEPAIYCCPHCGSDLLWNNDRGTHCDGCDDFAPQEHKIGRPLLVRSKSVSCDSCYSQGLGKHYCDLHGVPVRDMNIVCCLDWQCKDPKEGNKETSPQ